MIKLKLKRNLRKKLKQGHPWVYRENLSSSPKVSGFASLSDNKGEVVRGFYDAKSALAFRSLDLKSLSDLKTSIEKAVILRDGLDKEKTNAYRLINGEGDGLSGFICDIYDATAVVQYDGEEIEKFWLEQKPEVFILNLVPKIKRVILKSRQSKNEIKILAGGTFDQKPLQFKENSILFETDLEKAQKTGFFLDQRDNRNYVKKISRGKEVWNIFSYTGGFSIYAGIGGAKKVMSVDVSKGALEQAEINWSLNKLEDKDHEILVVDAFDFLKSKNFKTDMIIVDPPSMTSGKDSKEQAVKKYINLYSDAAKKLKPGGDLILSSCSSRIDFNDFNEVVKEALSQARLKAKVLRVSGQGADHPYPHACEELRYLKFMHLKLD